MAECIIARGGGRSDGGSSGPPVIPGMHTILTTITDSAGVPIEDLSVHCKDGAAWYNYHTNEKGQVLFVTNSGAANITAWNFSLNGNYKYLDQEAVTKNLDAPIGSTTILNLSLARIAEEQSFTAMQSNIYQPRTAGLFSGKCKVRVSNHANLFLGGAGGGGDWSRTDSDSMYGGGGGGGGGITIANSIQLNKLETYNFFIGGGGAGGYIAYGPRYVTATSGGSTTAFGYTATGGGGGNQQRGGGGVAGTGTYSGGAAIFSAGNGNGQNSQWSNWGGGGGSCAWSSNFYGGSPGGGDCIAGNHGYSGINGGGGGAGGHSTGRDSSLNANGGLGSGGKISFTLY